MQIAPEIKLGEVLQRLIAEDQRPHVRQLLCEDLQITSAALSQYLNGKHYPRLPHVVSIAEFFGVSLNHLLLGEEHSREHDAGPLLELHASRLLHDMHERTARHQAAVMRVLAGVAQEVDQVTRQVLLYDETTWPEGFIPDGTTHVLEQFSLETWLALRSPHYDVVVEGQEGSVGGFLPVVIGNLRQGRKYHYLIAGGPEGDASARRLREQLREAVGSVPKTRLSIGVTAPFLGEMGFYRLDAEALQKEHPAIHEQVRPYLNDRAILGYAIPPNRETKGDVLMEADHRDYSYAMVKRLLAKVD